MPPFRYEAFVNPYIGSISELMGKRGDIDADAVTRVGDIQAADIARRGQAWGSAVEGLGNIAGKAFADYAQAKKDAPRLAEEAVLRQERVDAANDASQMRRGEEFMGTFRQKPDPNYLPNPATGESRLQGPAAPDNRNIYKVGQYGVQMMDPQLAEQALVDAGFGAHINKLMPMVDAQNKRNTEFLSGKRRVMGQTAQDALTILRTTQGDGSPTQYRTAVEFAGNSLVKNGVIRAEDLADVIAQGAQLDRAGQETFLLNLMKQGGAETTFEAPGQNRYVGGMAAGTTGEKPVTTTLGNPISMMEDGNPVTVQEVERSDGTSTWIHLDKTPVTGRLTGMPGKQEDVMRNGQRTPILEGTRQPGDLPVPTPQAPQAPSWDVLTDPTGKQQRYVAKGSKEAAGLMQQGWKAGSPAGAKPPTGVQSKALGFFTRMDNANKDLESVEDTINKMGTLGVAWMNNMPNFLQGEAQQLYTQAQRAFTETRLRKDSGAAIPEQEFANDRRLAFAQPGDGPKNLEQKRRYRQNVMSGLAFESGPALKAYYGDDAADEIVQRLKPQERTVAMVSADGKTTFNIPVNEVAQALKDGLRKK